MAGLVGEAFLSSFFQVILDKLASSDFMDYLTRRGKLDDKLLKKLDITLNSINHVLDEAETKQYQSTYVKKWLDDLKHVVYEADQLLDEIATDAPLKKLKAESQPATSKVQGFFSAFTNPFESRIKELLENLDFLAKQKDMLGLKEGTCASNEGGVSWKPLERLPTTSLVDESSIYGRDGDKEQIIKFLLSDNGCGNQVPIITIVGLAGMGKTTLAQLVYNDHMMNEQFEIKAWVYVSESFDVVGLTKAILTSFQSSADCEDLNLLQHQLQQRLIGKKYLLVLDDVWSKNGERWERLLLPFNLGSSESKIIVTTRDKEVALVMKSTKLLHLKQLEKGHCRSLFVRHAFHGKNASDYPNLESIGKNIVDKCGGLPLAVKTLGNLLRRKFSPREWVKILETDVWCLSNGDSNINPILRLSYHNLPSPLKRCFSYCSIFPRGYKFGKEKLIKLWGAEGLLKCCRIDKSEEELGMEFFDDLESISFFQQEKVQSDKLFIMHDLVNDLAKSVSGEFCLQIKGDKVQGIPERTRHIWCSLESDDGDKILEHIYKIKGLRSLVVRAKDNSSQHLCSNAQHDLFSRLKYLRMLSFSYCNISELTEEISNLKLLHYLDLAGTKITSLPDSICMLHNLQTLMLNQSSLMNLPSDFYKLVNLRHLNLEGTRVKKMPKQIGRLNHLQTLTCFVVGEHSGSDIKELAKLNHLHRKFRIQRLENVIDPTDAAEANLKDKKHLEELDMTYGVGRKTKADSIIETQLFVLEALQPNRNLNKLSIEGYRGGNFPNWLGDCHLPHLVSLFLGGCKFCTQLPPLGQLLFLKKLSIWGCHGIEIIGPEFYSNNSSNVSFRSLEILMFCGMFNWKEWLCLEVFTSLKELSIKHCPKLKGALPQHLPSLQKLEIRNCQELEASTPKADNISELQLVGCENILLNELPSSLKSAIVGGTKVIESSTLDLRKCNSLHSLSILDWHSSSWPFALDLFTNLQSLYVCDCPWLESFPGGGFPLSLSYLYIRRCPKLIASREKWGLFKLNSLKLFSVSDDFENMESFPEEGLLPPTISFLMLKYCSKLKIINYRGLLHLTSLKSLNIYNCPCLERLPEEGLPNSLSTLEISYCPLLKQQYQKEEGERWDKICHIPSVIIRE